MKFPLFIFFLPLLLLTRAQQQEEEEEEEGGVEIRTGGLSWLSEIAASSNQPHHRAKRFFGFPEGSNMEAKWSLNFPFDTFTFYKAKFQLGLPIKVPFPAALIVGAGAGRKKRGLGEAEDPRNVLEDHRIRRQEARKERLQIYEYLEGVLETAGVSGRSCLLRAICEVAYAPFDQGMVGEMVNTVLTASVAGKIHTQEEEEEEEEARYHEYLQAELEGRMEGKCNKIYRKCEISPFDMLPNVVHRVL
ncbi:uncharacterized protein LOC123503608 [Portunus trituberculatus]|uniref:uncharacterized protein LOC123503608 n=1 Tax=Portunus trituberculatus TaxID=210409 RepID=UPI001E1CF4EB|nr:uncharacterized protein LOC123503608 [Portunus trituberculatus]